MERWSNCWYSVQCVVCANRKLRKIEAGLRVQRVDHLHSFRKFWILWYERRWISNEWPTRWIAARIRTAAVTVEKEKRKQTHFKFAQNNPEAVIACVRVIVFQYTLFVNAEHEKTKTERSCVHWNASKSYRMLPILVRINSVLIAYRPSIFRQIPKYVKPNRFDSCIYHLFNKLIASSSPKNY